MLAFFNRQHRILLVALIRGRNEQIATASQGRIFDFHCRDGRLEQSHWKKSKRRHMEIHMRSRRQSHNHSSRRGSKCQGRRRQMRSHKCQGRQRLPRRPSYSSILMSRPI